MQKPLLLVTRAEGIKQVCHRDSRTHTVMQHCSQQPAYEIKRNICQ